MLYKWLCGLWSVIVIVGGTFLLSICFPLGFVNYFVSILIPLYYIAWFVALFAGHWLIGRMLNEDTK